MKDFRVYRGCICCEFRRMDPEKDEQKYIFAKQNYESISWLEVKSQINFDPAKESIICDLINYSNTSFPISSRCNCHCHLSAQKYFWERLWRSATIRTSEMKIGGSSCGSLFEAIRLITSNFLVVRGVAVTGTIEIENLCDSIGLIYLRGDHVELYDLVLMRNGKSPPWNST